MYRNSINVKAPKRELLRFLISILHLDIRLVNRQDIWMYRNTNVKRFFTINKYLIYNNIRIGHNF